MENNGLTRHGRLFRTYDGAGSLIIGENTYPCSVRMGQTHSGKLVLIAEGLVPLFDTLAVYDVEPKLQLAVLGGRQAVVRGLEWVSVDGGEFKMPGPGTAPMAVTFLAREVLIENVSDDASNEFRFFLTNARLGKSITWTDRSMTYTISRLAGYDDEVRYLQSSGECGVTACLTVTGGDGQRLEDETAEEAASHICSLLSLALGSVVSWITMEVASSEGLNVSHRAHKTSSSRGMQIISPTYDLEKFVVSSLRVYGDADNAWSLSWTIRLFADAVRQSDHLELRTLKLATLMEHLAARFSSAFDEGGYLVPSDKFEAVKRDLRSKIKNLLKELLPELSSAVRQEVSLHVYEFSRRSFDHTLKRMAKHLRLDVADDEWQRLVSVRNCVVHQARFLPEEEGGSPWEQFSIVLSIATRVMLAILRYKGHYYDWAKHVSGEWTGPEMSGRIPMRYV